MSSASKDFSAFGDLLKGVKLPKSVKDHLSAHGVWAKWAEIVGPELSRLTSPMELKHKVLEIQVAHQAWAQQLQFLKPSILAKIRLLCPNLQVKDLEFRVGRIEKRGETEDEQAAFARRLKLRQARLTERQELTLRGIEDPDLRSIIRQVMEAASKRTA